MDINSNYFVDQDAFLKYSTDKEKEYLIFVGSLTNISIEKFNNKKIKIFGAIFSHITYNNNLYEKGLISIEINKELNLDFIENIAKYNFDYSSFSESKSIVTVLDGFCNYNEEFLSKLFENVGFDTNIVGGGAGVLEDKTRKVIFNNNGFFSDSAILLSFKKEKIRISSKHGWDYLSGPFIVTSSKKNMLESVDYMDAFDVYKDIIKKDSGIEINKENFLEISKNYPLEIVKYTGNNILRDPISFENGKLVLIAQIRTNCMINILKGNKENLIKAANDAVKEVIDENSNLALVFNCITRKNFLDEDFKDELDSIYKQISSNNMVGAITIGEIANNGNKYINFLNKTFVIGGI